MTQPTASPSTTTSAPSPGSTEHRGRTTKAVVASLVGGITAFLSSVLVALQGPAGSTGFDTVTAAQWVTAVLAFFLGLGLTGGATYATPNRPRT